MAQVNNGIYSDSSRTHEYSFTVKIDDIFGVVVEDDGDFHQVKIVAKSGGTMCIKVIRKGVAEDIRDSLTSAMEQYRD